MRILIKQVVADEAFKEPNRTFYRTVEIPHPPAIGMVLYGDGWQVTVDCVEFGADTGLYTAVPERLTVGHYQDTIKEMQDNGWFDDAPRIKA